MPPTSDRIAHWIKKLTTVRRGGTRYGAAPHKGIFLLAISELIATGRVCDNKFYVDSHLVLSFRLNWNHYVRTQHIPDLTQPFYYLQSDGFWKVTRDKDTPLQAPKKSIIRLQEEGFWGSLDMELFELLKEPTAASLLRTAIKETFFPTIPQRYIPSQYTSEELKPFLVEEPIPLFDKKHKHVEEEESSARISAFREVVIREYNYSCAFTSMRLRSLKGYSLLDACHIIPLKQSHDNRISNGIALSPNIHRAFDAGIVSVDRDFRIMVSNQIEESGGPYSLRALVGKKILLPQSPLFYPDGRNFEWHREKVFVG